MADYVQSNLEIRSKDISIMKEIQVLDDSEIKHVVRTYSDLLYALMKRRKRQSDFLKLIRFELSMIDRLRQEKSDGPNDRNVRKSEALIRRIKNRVNKIFQQITVGGYFKHDTRMWLTYIEFCKREFDAEMVSSVFRQMLKLCSSRNPVIWMKALDWEEIERIPTCDCKRLNLLYQDAMQFNPLNKSICLRYLKFLCCIDQMADLDDQMTKEHLLSLALVVAKHAISDCNATVDECVKILQHTCNEKELQHEIIKHVIEALSSERNVENNRSQNEFIQKPNQNSIHLCSNNEVQLNETGKHSICMDDENHDQLLSELVASVKTSKSLTNFERIINLKLHILDHLDQSKNKVTQMSKNDLFELIIAMPCSKEICLRFASSISEQLLQRKTLEYACKQYGCEDVDVWVEWARFELQSGCFDNPPSIRSNSIGSVASMPRLNILQMIYNRALEHLRREEDVSEFSNQFTMIKMGLF